MPGLLSDVDGKITHILAVSCGLDDEPRVNGLLQAFGKDVRITLGYSAPPKSDILPEEASIELHRSMLEKLVAGASRDAQTDLVALMCYPYIWLQDIMHVTEEREIMSSFGGDPSQSVEFSKEIFDVLAGMGFKLRRNTSGLILDGGNVIVGEEKIFVGVDETYRNWLFASSDRSPKRVRGSYEQELAIWVNSGKQHLKARFRVLDHRSVEYVPSFTRHIDLFFTPVGETFVVGDVGMALRNVKLPQGIIIDPAYEGLESSIDNLACKLGEKNSVVRIPLLPPLCLESGGSRSVQLLKVISFNNVLQETADGLRRVYMPTYKIGPHSPISSADVIRLQDLAQKAYESLGSQVRLVPFSSEYGQDGSLRCTVKVLKRDFAQPIPQTI